MVAQLREPAPPPTQIDLTDGRLVAYWTPKPGDEENPSRYRFDVTLWRGEKIANGRAHNSYKVYDWSGFRHTRYPVWFFMMDGSHCRDESPHFAYWYGTGYGPQMYLRAKRGKRAFHHNVASDTYQCCACGRSYTERGDAELHVKFVCRKTITH